MEKIKIKTEVIILPFDADTNCPIGFKRGGRKKGYFVYVGKGSTRDSNSYIHAVSLEHEEHDMSPNRSVGTIDDNSFTSILEAVKHVGLDGEFFVFNSLQELHKWLSE